MVRPFNVHINHVNITVWFLVKIAMAQPKELLSMVSVMTDTLKLLLDLDFYEI